MMQTWLGPSSANPVQCRPIVSRAPKDRPRAAPSRSRRGPHATLWSMLGRGTVAATALRALKKLVIAEKPKVAQQIAAALKIPKAAKGHFEGKDLIITSACGHLLQHKSLPWITKLPMFPAFDLEVQKGKDSYLAEIRRLARHAQVLVNACDAGREGELIFRRIQKFLDLEKMPFERLWLQSLTAAAIRLAMDSCRPGEEYDNLADAADCRARWDWLVGINGTAVLRKSKWLPWKCSVGRVMTPTLLLVVQREEEIEKFKPVPYQEVKATFRTEDGDAYEGKHSTLHQAHAIDFHATREDWIGLEGVVLEDKSAKCFEKPQPLMNLADLQRTCSRLFGMSPSATLQSVQKLYESEMVTYPRTDSRCLPSDHQSVVRGMLKSAAEQEEGLIPPELLLIASKAVSSVSGIFDDAKVTDHYAIIPTDKGLQKAKLSKSRDAQVLRQVVRHFVAAFLPPAKYVQQHRKTRVRDCVFTTSEKVLVEPGFKALEMKEPMVKPKLPSLLKKGTKVVLEKLKVTDQETKPPPRYTQADLLTAMEKCGKTVEEDLQGAMSAGIGTSATRACIIDKVLLQKWVVPKNGALQPSAIARQFKDSLKTLGLTENFSLEVTGRWELILKQIQEGHIDKDEGNIGMQKAVEDLVEKVKSCQAAPPALEDNDIAEASSSMTWAPTKSEKGGTKASSFSTASKGKTPAEKEEGSTRAASSSRASRSKTPVEKEKEKGSIKAASSLKASRSKTPLAKERGATTARSYSRASKKKAAA
ncbi:Putative DNA topoisomerase 3 (DNA topoisomerase III) [Durusdinium trenchii]|uniref:DNA topoisomerase n=1 Tax=Durusdinium trenchii TaxID=1381693 RepID=A0ABP0HDV9_9DINO